MSVSADRLQAARTVADAVLYEGYLLYPYRASSDKNSSSAIKRTTFGVAWRICWLIGTPRVHGPKGTFILDRGGEAHKAGAA